MLNCGYPCTAAIPDNIVFRCIIPIVFYLQLNRGSLESKHNSLVSVLVFVNMALSAVHNL